MIGNYFHTKSRMCHITSSVLKHVLKMLSPGTNASGRRWRPSPLHHWSK